MNIVEEVEKLFSSVKSSIQIDDRATTFRFNSAISQKPSLTDISIKSFLQFIPKQDTLKLSLVVEEQEPIGFISTSYDSGFVESLNEYFEHYESSEQITLKIEIDKNSQNGCLSIYSWNSFNAFVKSLPLLQFVDILSEATGLNNCLKFKYLEKSLPSFETKWLKFGYDFEKCEFQSQLHLVEANCYFNDSKKYPYTPIHFDLTKRPLTTNAIVEKLDILTVAFSIISIFDYSKIGSSTIEYRLNGYKLVQGSFELDRELINNGKNYLELFDWIYSSEGNVADKLGVARNIISLYIRADNISADSGLIHSIKSAHQTYLKDNVASYISLRSNILDELSWISQKSSEVIQSFLSAYKQSSLTFVSFFISIFLLRTLSSGNFLKVFNNEVTTVALAFLVLSVVFLLFSRLTVLKERNRLIRKYGNLKSRYTDLLIEEDINRVLNNDSEFEYEKNFINSRIKQYTWLWSITIGVLLLTILSVSEMIPCSFYH
ncbi:hypothetical protein [uncultured Maribacter sp.]|uniref:hypothetical protein n=1 Tax=uncultured Maribacter sp. TaxID=431308 RepID=UPI0030EF85F4|tara:strand:- start:3941 stop:5407 length:1467 start_codon:yes stop_codon:yes gene_type:complete